jgi:hypothetical protein
VVGGQDTLAGRQRVGSGWLGQRSCLVAEQLLLAASAGHLSTVIFLLAWLPSGPSNLKKVLIPEKCFPTSCFSYLKSVSGLTKSAFFFVSSVRDGFNFTHNPIFLICL